MRPARTRPRRAAAWGAAAALAASTLSLGLAAPAEAAEVNVSVTDVFGNGVNANLDVYQEDTGNPGTYLPFQDDVLVPGTGQLSLPDGNYKVEVRDDNGLLRTEWYDNKLDEASASVVAVAGAAVTLSPVVLEPRAVIRGVVKAGGVPAGGVFVQSFEENSFDVTDSLGRFAVPVQPGTHHLVFDGDDYPTEFWQDEYDLSAADPVVVSTGDVDLGTVNVGPGAGASGTVTGPSGAPLRGINVSVFQELAPFNSVSGSTNQQGQFSVRGLPPGTYKVVFGDSNGEFLQEYWNDASSPATATPLVLAADQTAANINASLALDPAGGSEPPGTDASGVVRDSAGRPIAAIAVAAYTTAATRDEAQQVDVDFTDSQGRYFLTNLNGDDQFKLEYDDYFHSDGDLPYRREWYQDKRTYATADPVTVKGTKVTGLDVVLEQAGGIRGTVTSEAGARLPFIDVEFYDLNGNFRGGTGGESDGTFETNFLAPGDYYVLFAFGGDYDGNEFVPEWFDDAATQQLAQVVTVESGKFVDGVDGALAATLRAVERPSFQGKARVGRTLHADHGLWNLSGGTTYGYQWVVGSTVVGTSAAYVVLKRDAGKKLSLRVSARNDDLTGLATSKGARVKFAAKVVASKKNGVLKAKVNVAGLKKKAVKGKLKIKKGKETLATLTVEKAIASIQISKILGLEHGKNKLKIVYVGTKRIASDDAKVTIRR